MRKPPPGGWSKQNSAQFCPKAPATTEKSRPREKCLLLHSLFLSHLLFSLQAWPLHPLQNCTWNISLQFYELGTLFGVSPGKRRISERKFWHLMVRKLHISPMGTSHLFFIYIFFLKEHLNTISTCRPTFKPNSLRGCFCTKFCNAYPLPKILELLRKNVGLS